MGGKKIYLVMGILVSGIFLLAAMPPLSTASAQLNEEKMEVKTIYIIRHAKSSHADPTLTDFDRPLDDKGNQNALAMGLYLKDEAHDLELMVCSPSKRTQETASLIAGQMNFDLNKIILDSSLYNCSAETYLKVIQRIDDRYNHVAIVAHNPATTYIANFLQKNENFSEVTTGSVVAIQFNIKSWEEVLEGKGQLLFTKDPDDIGKQGD